VFFQEKNKEDKWEDGQETQDEGRRRWEIVLNFYFCNVYIYRSTWGSIEKVKLMICSSPDIQAKHVQQTFTFLRARFVMQAASNCQYNLEGEDIHSIAARPITFMY
jgi:hypothetical protein